MKKNQLNNKYKVFIKQNFVDLLKKREIVDTEQNVNLLMELLILGQ